MCGNFSRESLREFKRSLREGSTDANDWQLEEGTALRVRENLVAGCGDRLWSTVSKCAKTGKHGNQSVRE